MDEQASEIDVEVDNDEESAQEKSPAKNQVRAQDVWREFLKTSGGRDKALVLHIYLSSRYPDRLTVAPIVYRN